MERIEGLQQEHRDLQSAFRTNFALNDPKALMAEQRQFTARLHHGTAPENRPDERELLQAMWAIAARLKPVS